VATGESVGAVLARVEDARRSLAALVGGPSAKACELGRVLSADMASLLDDLGAGSPAARAAARAAGQRFDSHVLAASLLEASHASSASVFELLGRGLIRLSADVERLARTRRLPA
jgi:hypothetical protein